LLPPGYELYKYSQSIGAVFTPEGLENEIKDVMENGLELAASVSLKQDGNHITVTMKRLANEGMCIAIRREHPGICVQTGCPICSFVGCMVVSGTGKKARIEKVHVADHIVNITFELI
jgi:predicted nucleic acid-binding Zn finger protein